MSIWIHSFYILLCKDSLSGRMMIFDGLDFTTRVIKLRSRQAESCVMCRRVVVSSTSTSQTAPLTRETIESTLNEFDYNQFCGVNNYTDKTVSVRLLSPTDRISCLDYYSNIMVSEKNQTATEQHLLIDTRPKCQFEICSLPNSISESESLWFYCAFFELIILIGFLLYFEKTFRLKSSKRI